MRTKYFLRKRNNVKRSLRPNYNFVKEINMKRKTPKKKTCSHLFRNVVESTSSNESTKKSSGNCKVMKDIYKRLYGIHETQVSENGESGLPQIFVSCTKYPGHKEFIPANNFKIKHLPNNRRDGDVYRCIKALINVTVRLAVQLTSPSRPRFWPNTDVPYPSNDIRGKTRLRTGTGRVSRVMKFRNGIEARTCRLDKKVVSKYKTCPCTTCQSSMTPSTFWAEIWVYTARHVVYDDQEASVTTCRLYFNDRDSPVVLLSGLNSYQADIEEDRCWLRCFTCDLDLINKLYRQWRRFDEIWDIVDSKYWNSSDMDLAVAVSHPHGCAKHVTIGQWMHRFQVGEYEDLQYSYTTNTCPGSSGASVLIVGLSGGSWCYSQPLHRGKFDSKLNCSGLSWDYYYPDKLSPDDQPKFEYI